MNIGAPEIILILVVLLLLFGAKKLPELARSIGRSTSEFKEGMKEGGPSSPEPTPPPPAQAQSPAPAQPPAASPPQAPADGQGTPQAQS